MELSTFISILHTVLPYFISFAQHILKFQQHTPQELEQKPSPTVSSNTVVVGNMECINNEPYYRTVEMSTIVALKENNLEIIFNGV